MQTRTAMQWTAGALIALSALTACNDTNATGLDADLSSASSASANMNGVIYDQVEFLGNPLVAEVTLVKKSHDNYNQKMPYNPERFIDETKLFITTVAGRPQARADLLASVLYATSDMLIVDTNNPTSSAGWLSWVPQVNAVYGNGSGPGWGGRRLSDDVVDVGLVAIFSSFLSDALGDGGSASCAPFALPLCTDNVGADQNKAFSTTFPYLASPTL